MKQGRCNKRKKSYQSWAISDESLEAIKEEVPKMERDPKKRYVHAPEQGRKPMPAKKALEEYSMCCGRAFSGKLCPGNMTTQDISKVVGSGLIWGGKELKRNPGLRAHRWLVDSFCNHFLKFLVRFENKAANDLTLIQFACAVIVWRKILRVHLNSGKTLNHHQASHYFALNQEKHGKYRRTYSMN